MIRRVNDVNLAGKVVFLRVDFNVPIVHGKITEPHLTKAVEPWHRASQRISQSSSA